jgi:hypothetical protein
MNILHALSFLYTSLKKKGVVFIDIFDNFFL